MLHKENAKKALVSLINQIQKHNLEGKMVKPIVIEDRLNKILEDMILEVMMRITLMNKNSRN